jgi:AbrB family looped-hinge helix DNA binding protein
MSERTIKLSSRGQLVIPAEMRRLLDLERGTRFEVTVDDGQILLTPIRDEEWRSLRGMLEEGPSLTEELNDERRREREREAAKLEE